MACSRTARTCEEECVHVERWNGGHLPAEVASVPRKVLRDLGESDDELAMSLDLAASDSGLTFIASDGGRPVGVLIAAPEPRNLSAFVRWIVVAPDARRRGVATALMDALAATPELEGLTGMVDQEDPTALGFWRDRGWTVRRPRPGRRRLLMSVDLPEVRSEAA
jgi:GNAT superfamily N-acetyltransferase